jgi:hypothetical protein
VALNQRRRPPIDRSFAAVGRFHFTDQARITISNTATDGYVVVDAVQLLPVAESQ